MSEPTAPSTQRASGGRPPIHLSPMERIGLVVQRTLGRALWSIGAWAQRLMQGSVAMSSNRGFFLLTTTGRRSGRRRTVVLQYFRDGDAMILSASNSGARSHPAWYFNLTAHPNATADIGGRRIPVRAEVLAPDEAVVWWQRIVERDPSYARYARATSRTIPIVRLVPLGSDGHDQDAVGAE